MTDPFGLAEVRREGAPILSDPTADVVQWMELCIPAHWTRDDIIRRVDEWIAEERN